MRRRGRHLDLTAPAASPSVSGIHRHRGAPSSFLLVGAVACGCWPVLAPGITHNGLRTPGFSTSGAMAARSRTRPVRSAPGAPTWRSSSSAIRSGGSCPSRLAHLARRRSPALRANARHSGTGRRRRPAAAGALDRGARPVACCSPPARRSNGRASTSDESHGRRRPCRWRARLRARSKSARTCSASPARACSGSRWRSPRIVDGAAASRGCTPPSASVRASIRCALRRASRIERLEDARLGEEAIREREETVEVEHELHEQHLPIVIEPTLVDVPKSTRVVKERQKPLFTRAGRHQAAAGRPARLGTAARRGHQRRIARDDLAADREEAEGLSASRCAWSPRRRGR